METELIEMGSISSRGQVAIPSGIRKELGLEEGTKVLFIVEKGTVLMKKVTAETFASITKPLKEEAKRSGLKEADVERIIHNLRKSRR